MKSLFFLALNICLVHISFSQNLFTSATIDLNQQEDLNKIFSKYEIVETDLSELYDRLTQIDRPDLEFKLPGLEKIDVELFEKQLVKSNYKLQTTSGNASSSIPDSYIGYAGIFNVHVTIDQNFLAIYIDSGSDQYYIELLRNFGSYEGEDLFVFYKATDVLPVKDVECGHDRHEKFVTQYKKEGSSENKSVGDCLEVEMAIATDWQMHQKFGSAQNVEDEVVNLLSLMQTNYDDEFDDELKYFLVDLFIVDCSGCDPWTTSNNIELVLEEFTDWGQSGGFDETYDVATLWSARDFNGGTIGLAWVGAICTSVRYNVCEHFTSSNSLLRVLWSHELGHNWNCDHDGGNNFIMSPSVNNTNTWSTLSMNTVNSYVPTRNCLDDCPAAEDPPVADFLGSPLTGCTPLTVNFTDISIGNVDSWLWTFEGGTPASSTAENPSVVYEDAGEFDVTLEVTNNGGSDQITKQNYVNVSAQAIPDFIFNVDGKFVDFTNLTLHADVFQWEFGDGGFSGDENPVHIYEDDGIYPVTLFASNDCSTEQITKNVVISTPPAADFEAEETIGCADFEVQFVNNSSPNATGFEWTFEGGTPSTSDEYEPTVLYTDAGLYSVTLEVMNMAGTDSHVRLMYIDVNDEPVAGFDYTIDGNSVEFEDLSERAGGYEWFFGDGEESDESNPTHEYMGDGEFVVTQIVSNECGNDTMIQTIVISNVPNTNWSSDIDSACVPISVQFTDESNGEIDSWEWTFEGGTPAISSEQNPVVVYMNEGSYDVRLITTNQFGSDTLERIDYIMAFEAPLAEFDFEVSDLTASFVNLSLRGESYEWSFGDGETSFELNPEHIYEENAIYTVCLTVVNQCGMDSICKVVSLEVPPVAEFTTELREGCAPLTVDFVDLSQGNPTEWEWTFEGGIPGESTEQNPTVMYENAGIFSVSLTAKNGAGMSESFMEDYVIVNDVPEADFEYVIDNFEVDFTNLSDGGTSFFWEFGDSETSMEENPVHIYESDGFYEVILYVMNECGTDTVMTSIPVGTTSTQDEEQISFEIFPNPNQGEFTVISDMNLSLDQITIYNILGKKMEFSSSGGLNKNLYLSLENPVSGNYFVLYQAEQRSVVKKICVAGDSK